MSRTKRIDENTTLDAAETVIRENGAAGLTIEAVARKAQVSVGGLQYSFRSKVALITGMFERWGREYKAQLASLYPEPVDAFDEARRDIVVGFKQSIPAQKKAASIIAALLQSPEHLAPVRDWYQSRLSGIDMTDARSDLNLPSPKDPRRKGRGIRLRVGKVLLNLQVPTT